MWTRKTGWVSRSDNNLKRSAQLVFLFGDSTLLKDRGHFEQIHSFYPNAYIIGCSTAGEIAGVQVFDNSLVITAVFFEETQFQFAKTELSTLSESLKAGERLAEKLEKEGLVHVFVLSEGLNVNRKSAYILGYFTQIFVANFANGSY